MNSRIVFLFLIVVLYDFIFYVTVYFIYFIHGTWDVLYQESCDQNCGSGAPPSAKFHLVYTTSKVGYR